MTEAERVLGSFVEKHPQLDVYAQADLMLDYIDRHGPADFAEFLEGRSPPPVASEHPPVVRDHPPIPQPFRPGLYQHFKGGLYTANRLVLREESVLWSVEYVHNTGGPVWNRLWSVWNATVQGPRGPRPRFLYVGHDFREKLLGWAVKHKDRSDWVHMLIGEHEHVIRLDDCEVFRVAGDELTDRFIPAARSTNYTLGALLYELVTLHGRIPYKVTVS